jgi:hypothetical protein
MSRPPVVPVPNREFLLPQDGLRIAPSNINPWRMIRRAGDLFSIAQLVAMPSYNLDPATCDYVVVRSPVSMAEFYWPASQPAPVYLCPCPIIPTATGEPRADGRVLVIAPAGMKKLVWPDGSITRPRANKRSWRRPA